MGQHRQLVLLARVRAVDTAVLLQERVGSVGEGCARQFRTVHLSQEDRFQVVLLLFLSTGCLLRREVEQLRTHRVSGDVAATRCPELGVSFAESQQGASDR